MWRTLTTGRLGGTYSEDEARQPMEGEPRHGRGDGRDRAPAEAGHAHGDHPPRPGRRRQRRRQRVLMRRPVPFQEGRRARRPAIRAGRPGGSGAGRRRCGRRGARLVLGHRPRSGRGNAGRPGCGARRARGVLQGEGHRGVSRVRFGRAQLPVVDRLVLPGGGAAGFRRLESGRRRRRLLPGLRHVHGRPLGVFDRRV